jgi:hypothetical protein
MKVVCYFVQTGLDNLQILLNPLAALFNGLSKATQELKRLFLKEGYNNNKER